MKRKNFWYLAAEITIVFDAVFEEEGEPPGILLLCPLLAP